MKFYLTHLYSPVKESITVYRCLSVRGQHVRKDALIYLHETFVNCYYLLLELIFGLKIWYLTFLSYWGLFLNLKRVIFQFSDNSSYNVLNNFHETLVT